MIPNTVSRHTPGTEGGPTATCVTAGLGRGTEKRWGTCAGLRVVQGGILRPRGEEVQADRHNGPGIKIDELPEAVVGLTRVKAP